MLLGLHNLSTCFTFSNATACIDEYDDEAFWDGMVDRLARDFIETYGNAVASMDQHERFKELQAFVDKYENGD